MLRVVRLYCVFNETDTLNLTIELDSRIGLKFNADFKSAVK